MDYMEYVKENRSKLKNYEWLKQFDEDTDGHRFTPMKFMGMKLKYGLDEPPDGIAGDRWMKQNAKTDITRKKVTLDDFRRGLSVDEYNDLINYAAWNSFDTLSLRVTEGLSEIIPRAQYEFTAFVRHFVRGPEFNKFVIHKVGWERYMRRFYDTRKEIGVKIEHLGHTWAIMCCQLFGDIALESLGYFEPDDPLIVDKKIWTVLPWAARSFALKGGDGYLMTSQNRYGITKDQSVVDFVMNKMEPVDAKRVKLFQQLDGAATLLGYCMHYDCRAGMGDYGPHIVEDGKILIIRGIYTNEPLFSWSEVAQRRNIPFSVNLAFIINPEKMGLQEYRVLDLGTSFTRPADFWPGVERVCMFLRYEPDTPEPLPLSKLRRLTWSEVPDVVNDINAATTEWYQEVAKMTHRQKVYNGYQVYSMDPSVGSCLRPFGLWDYCDEVLDFWEVPPVSSDSYYQVKGKVATEIMPQRLFTGAGWTDIPVKPSAKSKYRDDVLKRAYELGWESDLTGTKPIPSELKSLMDEDRIFRPDVKFNVPDNWMK